MEWFLGWRDIVAVVLLPPLLIAITGTAASRLSYPPSLRRILIWAAIFHLGMSIAYAFIYQFYYGYGGDAVLYFWVGERLYLSLFDDPLTALKVLILPSSLVSLVDVGRIVGIDPAWWVETRALAPGKLCTLFYPFGLGSFIGVSFLFSMTAFFARWLIFSTFRRMYSHYENIIAIATFFLPSVTFWASVPLKETVALIGVAIASWGLFKMIVEKKNPIFFSIVALLGINLIYHSKPYVLYAFVPATLLWIYLGFFRYFFTAVVRVVLTPLVVTGTVMLSFYLLAQTYAQQLLYQKFSELTRELMDAQQWHLTTTRSAYSLGEYTPTPAGILKVLPKALFTSLYRPWPWEVTSLPSLLNAVEGLVLLAVTLWVLWRAGPLALLRTIWNRPFLMFTVFWTLFFMAAMGFASYSFGALSRYKVPGFNFFPVLLASLIVEQRLAREQRQMPGDFAYA